MKALAVILMAGAATAGAQQLGTVAVADANVTTAGHAADVSAGRAALVGSSVITAKDHTAEVKLTRGGTVLVCRTSSLHLTGTPDTLAIGLDRGALELHTKASATDVLVTPDLRITMPAGGALDLRMRVSINGDTCLENRGKKAPLLLLNDAFGESSYQLKPTQHVLFEHGSLREVVDRETTPCGCPPEDLRPVPLAEALLHGGPGTVTPQQAAAANPFPAAQSEGLAPPPPLPPQAPGVTHTQVATTLVYDPARPSAPETNPASTTMPAPQLPAPQPRANPFRAVGHFFKRIFAR